MDEDQFFGSALVSVRIRIQIQLFTSMWIQIRIHGAKPMWIQADPDPDPGQTLLSQKLDFYMKNNLYVDNMS
jgi:hypothetical protein